jgi:hypothetical protein
MQFGKCVKERLKIVSQRVGFSHSCHLVMKNVTLGGNSITLHGIFSTSFFHNMIKFLSICIINLTYFKNKYVHIVYSFQLRTLLFFEGTENCSTIFKRTVPIVRNCGTMVTDFNVLHIFHSSEFVSCSCNSALDINKLLMYCEIVE